MKEVSLIRLYVLRATYAFVAVGLGLVIWPGLLGHEVPWSLWRGVGTCLLAAVSLLAVVGVFHPLKMLPLLAFELTWKLVWTLAIALPLWRSGALDEASAQTLRECLLGLVLVPAVIPWPYFVATYLKGPTERWR